MGAVAWQHGNTTIVPLLPCSRSFAALTPPVGALCYHLRLPLCYVVGRRSRKLAAFVSLLRAPLLLRVLRFAATIVTKKTQSLGTSILPTPPMT